MKHSKRSNLTVSDIALAYKRRDRQPFLGYRGVPETPGMSDFVQVGTGVFVQRDEIVDLEDVLTKDLPRDQGRRVRMQARWLTTARGKASADTEGVLKMVEDGVEGRQNMAVVCAKLEAMKGTVAVLGPLVSYIRRKVHENARASGTSDVLANVVLLMHAVFRNRNFGVEMYHDALVQALLTCLLGRRLGRGDHWVVRDLAAVVMQEMFAEFEEPVVRGRVGKTLVAVLTDSEAGLESLYGAIRGLSAMGRAVFDLQMRPHLPALLSALERAAEGCEKLDADLRGAVEEKIGYVCRAIEEVTNGQKREEEDQG
eukprot:GFKZ01000698.1.p2 GENE.GFKZ01000698.1~~GFKZ01000698.1.p2  ORF type:complete len:313 (-),score=43.93 GFKZ01000698.1:1326-2264(-)